MAFSFRRDLKDVFPAHGWFSHLRLALIIFCMKIGELPLSLTSSPRIWVTRRANDKMDERMRVHTHFNASPHDIACKFLDFGTLYGAVPSLGTQIGSGFM